METTAFNFHDESGKVFDTVKLNAGDDAGLFIFIFKISIEINKIYSKRKS